MCIDEDIYYYFQGSELALQSLLGQLRPMMMAICRDFVSESMGNVTLDDCLSIAYACLVDALECCHTNQWPFFKSFYRVVLKRKLIDDYRLRFQYYTRYLQGGISMNSVLEESREEMGEWLLVPQPEMEKLILNRLSFEAWFNQLNELTQQMVVARMKGYTHAQIGQQLGISERKVRYHLTQLKKRAYLSLFDKPFTSVIK